MCVLTFYIHLVFLWPSTWHFVQVLGSFKSLCSIVSCLLIASLNSEIPKESTRPLPPPPQQPPLPAHPPSKPSGPQPSFEPPTRQPAVPRLRPQAPPPQPPPQHTNTAGASKEEGATTFTAESTTESSAFQGDASPLQAF